jgi:hypothetical protein
MMNKKAFSESFSENLSTGKYTRWAVDLDEDTLYLLLWMVGEYGGRVPFTKEPTSHEDPDNLHLIDANKYIRAKEALRIIAAIFWNNRMSFKEGLNSMHRAIFRSKQNKS